MRAQQAAPASTPRATPPPALRIGAVDDAAEREADAVADRVLGGVLRRKCTSCEEEDTIRRRATGGAVSGDAPQAVSAALAEGGRPLPANDVAFFGPRLGARLDGVRVHDGPAADRAARSVGAAAFALGQDIVFARDRFRPATEGGRRLLAHELAHVVQSGPGMLRRQVTAQCTAVRILLPDVIIFEGSAGGITASLSTDIEAGGGPYTIRFDRGTGHLAIEPWPTDDVIMDVSLTARPASEIETYRAYLDSLADAPAPLEVVAEGGTAGDVTVETGPAWRFRARPISEAELIAQYGVDPSTLPEGQVARLPDPIGAAIMPSLVGGSFFGPTPMSMVPANSTGIMWTQGHLSLFATPGGQSTIVGYRGNLGWYVGEEFFSRLRIRPARDMFTYALNRGVPGSMRGDAAFTRMGGQQVVIYVPRDAATATTFAERLRTTEYDGDYRYSPPRPGATGTEGRMAERLAAAGTRPQAAICTNNCITVPSAEIETAIGGRPRLTLPDGTVIDLIRGTPEGGTTPDPYRTGRASDMTRWAEEGALPQGASRIAFTPRAATAVGVVRVGGGLMLIYGAYRTQERLRDTYETPAFRRTVGEEAGAWSFGLIGTALGAGAATAGAAALSGSLGGAVLCAPGGPVDLVCVAIGAAGGLVGGFVFGTVGALIGGEVAEATE